MESEAVIVILALIGSAGVACAAPLQKSDDAPPEPPVTSCAVPRPQACTMEYIPVCGHLYSGERKTYSNACAACSDSEVSGRHPGACKEPEPDESEPSGAAQP